MNKFRSQLGHEERRTERAETTRHQKSETGNQITETKITTRDRNGAKQNPWSAYLPSPLGELAQGQGFRENDNYRRNRGP
jgi:hypothetical protein